MLVRVQLVEYTVAQNAYYSQVRIKIPQNQFVTLWLSGVLGVFLDRQNPYASIL